METTQTIGPEMQVNRIIQLFPGTLPVFHAAGIDSCCGGALPVEEAARRHGFEPEQLLAELRRAAGEAVEQA
jgi:iron-sulfur cluster repair protein YtfE (RIC family)